MKKAGNRLFNSLGELRDVQEIEEWVGKLGDVADAVAGALLRYLASGDVSSRRRRHERSKLSIVSSGCDGAGVCRGGLRE